MSISIRAGRTVATIDTKGGYIATLADQRGDILYPKQQLSTTNGSQKIRGGCHVCLPNFGPGGKSGLEQHGFGRISQWQIINRSRERVELSLQGVGQYASLVSRLVYQIYLRRLVMELHLANTGTAELSVAPAFHPYFFVSGTAPVLDNQTLTNLEPLAETVFVAGDTRRLLTGGRSLILRSMALPCWAIWTDQIGPYICVEPSHSGNSFVNSWSQTDILTAGCERLYRLQIEWQ